MASIKEVISRPLNRPWLFWLAVFLLIFIPLYPKFPLFDILPGYIVRVRLEDFFILVFALIYLGLWIFGKVKPFKNPLFRLVIVYLAIGAASGVAAVFITKTVPMQTIHILVGLKDQEMEGHLLERAGLVICTLGATSASGRRGLELIL